MNYLARLRAQRVLANGPQTELTELPKARTAPLLSVLAVPYQGLSEKRVDASPSVSSVSSPPGAISETTSPHAQFCTVCGPIYANSKPATHAGHAYGMPIVPSCEWCKAGERPGSRPKIACSTCKHFERTDPNKISGPGNCAAGAVPAGMAQRVATLVCGAWVPSRISANY